MELFLKDKICVVIGGSKGLGFAAVQSLLKEGAKVAFCSRSTDNLEKAKQYLLKEKEIFGDQFIALQGDYNDQNKMDDFIKIVEDSFGNIDSLIVSSGGPKPGATQDFSLGDYENALQNNLLSPIYIAKKILPSMIEQQWGRIVFITSSGVIQPIPRLALSNIARSGLTSYAKTLSSEVASYNITVNCIMPGKIETERLMQITNANAKANNRSVEEQIRFDHTQIPAKRYGEPKELGALVAFLCSEIAGYITGSTIAVDGGAIKGIR